MELTLEENFWVDMHREYPKAMTLFGSWIDCYKETHRWNRMVNNDYKYHDLPFEMQIGIFIGFVREVMHDRYGEVVDLGTENWNDYMESFLIQVEEDKI